MDFFEYLDRIRPLINVNALNEMAGIPKNALNKHFHWRDGKAGQQLSAWHIPPIIRAIYDVFESPIVLGSYEIYPYKDSIVCENSGHKELYDDIDFITQFLGMEPPKIQLNKKSNPKKVLLEIQGMVNSFNKDT